MAMTKPRLHLLYLLSFAPLVHLGMLVSQAHAIPVLEQIKNRQFGDNAAPSLVSWATTGTVNARPSTNVINTSGGNAGFNNFFASAFAVLGDDSGVIGGDPNRGTHSISQSFTLPAALPFSGTPIISYDLSIHFEAVFDGKDSIDPPLGTATAKDTFKVFLNNQVLASADSTALPNCGPAINCANAQHEFNLFPPIPVRGLAPGVYTLKFELNETSVDGTANFTNTAVGIDIVSVTGVANLKDVPEPSTLILLGSGLAGIIVFGRKRLFKA